MEPGEIPKERRKIVIGIDFGTTYSGVAWADTGDRSLTINAIDKWPLSKDVRDGYSSPKVPTKLRYTDGGVEWGFSISPTAPQEEVIEWFKLGLDPSVTPYGSMTWHNDALAGREIGELVRDYVMELGKHPKALIRESAGGKDPGNIPWEVSVTVPAIWNDRARDRTRRACQRAVDKINFHNEIHLVSEPEAAAIYSLGGQALQNLKVGDTVVILDAGGGTVDLISYSITKLEPIIQIQEIGLGSGGVCGSAFLNMQFADFLMKKLGKGESLSSNSLANPMNIFEEKLKRWMLSDTPAIEPFAVPTPRRATSNRDSRGGTTTVMGSDLHIIFKPLIENVINLVMGHIRTTEEHIRATKSRTAVRAVVLVGGFGESTYLRESLRNALGDKILVLQPSYSWQAVMKGAVMKGLSQHGLGSPATPTVKSRVARQHHGIRCTFKYNKKNHHALKRSAYWCGYRGYRVIEGMRWFVKKGEKVTENQPCCFSFTRFQPVAEKGIKSIMIELFSEKKSNDPPFRLHESVRPFARLKADISGIPTRQLPYRQGADGRLYHVLDFQVEVVYESASTKYTLIYEGTRYKTLHCQYI